MKRINKILSKKRSFALLVFYILFFLLLTTGKELLHNHKPDIYEHADCPVLILNQVISSGLSVQFELPNEFIVESNVVIPQIFIISQSKPNIAYLRGPPLV